MIARSFIIAALLIVLVSSCALNRIFLVPSPLKQSDSFTRYVEKYEDSLTLTFNTDKSPHIVDSRGKKIEYSYSLESIFFNNDRGNEVHGWLMSPTTNYNGTTIYFLHGNAGNLVYNYPLIAPFVEAGYQVFAIDYSGFGFSSGKAKRKNVLRDANLGLEYLISRKDVHYNKLLVYGQSLGGHLSAVVATENQEYIDGLVIEGAFSSHKDIASEHVPLLGRIFTREMYSAEKSLPHFQKPVLIIHSTEDATIPYSHGQRLFEVATDPKQFYMIDKPHIRGPIYYLDSITHRIDNMLH